MSFFKKSKRIGLKSMLNSFALKLYNTDDGGAGVNTDLIEPPPVDANDSVPADNDPIQKPADLNVTDDEFKAIIDNDPEYATILRENQKKAKSTVDDKGVNADPLNPENGKDNPDTGKQEPSTDDKNSGKDGEFADNVIEGLKGEDFGKLSDDGKTALSSFFDKAEATQKELTEAQNKLSQYENDPVIKSRIGMLQKGQASYDVRGLTAAEKSTIMQNFKAEFGLDDAEAEKAFAMVKGGIEAAAQAMAQDITNNTLLQSETERKKNDVLKQGRDLILGLSEFNDKLKLKETDINKFYLGRNADGTPIYNEKHPELNNFVNGTEKIMKYLASNGIDYERAIKMGKKAVYALAAAGLDLPVALNTQERDAKIALDMKKQAWSRFQKNGNGVLPVDSNSTQKDRFEARKNYVDGGYDVLKLATDANYYEECLNQKSFDLDHKAKIDALAEKGRILEKARTKRK